MTTDGIGARTALAADVLAASASATIVLDMDGQILIWNLAAERMLGWTAPEVLGGALPAGLEHSGGVAPWLPALTDRLLVTEFPTESPPVLRIRCRHRSGRLVQAELRPTVLRTADEQPRGMVLVMEDVTARGQLERRLRYQAHHDMLTHLPNRDMFLDRSERALRHAEHTGSATGVLMIDLDRFKDVNDNLGHAAGDQLLAQIGPRLLAGTVRGDDLVARLSGDEFAVLLPDVPDVETAVAVAGRVLSALHTPFVLSAATADIAASIGVAVAPDHGTEIDELMRHADAAMYQAKETASGIVVYQPDEHGRKPTRFGLLGEMRRALEHHELVVYYQPQVDIATGRPNGAEALIRWQHPSRGLLGPGEFLPAIESTRLISKITDYVIDATLAQVASWTPEGIALPISVNVSARCLHDHTLPGRVLDALRRHDVSSDFLRLEITETAVMNDPETALAVLTELAAAGISVSLDDYGTGYSAMTYLQRLPVTELKVDQSFVAGLAAGTHDSVLVRSAIELGHHLNLTVVAEGVETADALAHLRSLGADTAQGYYLARPMPGAKFAAWLTLQPQPVPSAIS
jgi:diguanylate cyclase (GGDEF)-like protein/PAS domain S-box-containing protein